MAWVLWAFGTLVGEKKNCPFSHLGEGDMDEQDFLNRIAQSMRESEQQLFDSLGRQSSRATREQALKQVEILDIARNNHYQEDVLIKNSFVSVLQDGFRNHIKR